MKSIHFLLKLKKEEKLKITEPSLAVAQSYLQKSASHLESAKLLAKAGKLEEAVSLAYYGMYHCLLALLFRCGIKSENHSASIILLEELFQQQQLAEEIASGKRERVDKQYYVDFHLTETEVQLMLQKSEEFITQCKILINQLTEEKIKKLREELQHSLIKKE